MRSKFSSSRLLPLCGIVLFFAVSIAAQIPAPKDVVGFTPGDDKKLASWAQTVDYFKKLDAASDRVMFQEIGKTTMGVPYVYATISSPANLKQIKKYEDINAKLADPRKIRSSDAAAQALIKQGKTIVLVTCGIHSTEVGSHTASFLIAHRLASSNEPEIQNILENTIILLVPSLNPDGVDIVKNWYDKTVGTPYEGTTPPELYHKYVGHDNNRDWYAFSQVETQLTVDKIHNVWHPQIVHDIHQQGANGARLFLPPYMQPVEPNVPQKIIEGYTELGNAIAADLRSKGFQGITTDTTYDAWTPARAYSHYHGGVRILSETASVRLASPITIKFEDLRGAVGGLDAKKEAANFGPVWKGGEWTMRDITNYMTGAAFSLLNHAANNREKWLTRFYEIGKDAVRPRRSGEIAAYVLPSPKLEPNGSPSDAHFRRTELLEILRRGGVETKTVAAFRVGGTTFPDGSVVVPIDQPYGAFAKALLEKQNYPNLLDQNGNPIQPYDVTAHTLTLLMDVEAVPLNEVPRLRPTTAAQGYGRGCENGGQGAANYAIYRSSMGSMDEGWTRWIFEQRNKARCDAAYRTVTDRDIRSGAINHRAILFPDQPAMQILNGYRKGAMPDELTGGIGAEGVEKLKKFVEDGGTLVFLNSASDFAIDQFKLPVKDVTRGIPRKDFFIPGSILRVELDTAHPIAKGMPAESIAWFEDSPAFEIQTDPLALANNFRIVARYPSDPSKVLLSGWALGAEKIAGKGALVEFSVGKGKIVLFGFRPQYRAQSLATYPLMFNAMASR
jgi:hypothetical protein